MTTEIYHIGILVADLDQAVDYHRKTVRIGVHDPIVVAMDTYHDEIPRPAELRVAFTTEGPVHLELIQATDDVPLFSLAGRDPGLHHVAMWQEDVADRRAELLASGVRSLANIPGPAGDTFAWFAEGVDGVPIEYVDRSGKWAFDKYIATGETKYLVVPK